VRVLILSAYNAVSHAHLNSGLVEYLPEFDFTVISLTPRFFAWRSRGNSLSFAYEYRDILKKGYDLIFATSITDITALRGFVPEIADIPTIVYFHENQFAYPESRADHGNHEAKIVSIYNALASDIVIFNTEYNRSTYLKGVRKYLKKMPDHVPKGLVEEIGEKSRVLSVPVKKCAGKNVHTGTPVILWNHRWEYDKAPDRFLNALRELKRRSFEFKLHLAGQVFARVPDELEIIKSEFTGEILSCGYAKSREDYERIMSESSIVISTALHDYQGLAVIEAADAGCIPVLPDRMAYPELFSDEYLYRGNDETAEAAHCADKIIQASELDRCDLSRFYWKNLIDKYREIFTVTAERRG